MAEKISKTARASLGDKGETHAHTCPQCGGAIKYRDIPGGMYWICPKDDNRVKI
jgi:predicted RNA-binding Zn-ribbon protein involved in translation (DUF1610 family)